MPDRTALRALRVTVFTAVCVVLAATGHGLESGRWPTVAPLVLGAGLVLFAAARLAGRERSFAGIGAGVLAIQAVLHVVFVLCDTGHEAVAGTGLPSTGPATGAMPGMDMSALAPQAAEPRLGMSAAMALAHVLAGLATAAWLRRGEAALWSLCRWLAFRSGRPLRRLASLLGAALPQARTVAVPPGRPDAQPPAASLRHALTRRGPPCPAAV
jgi:hypothetical protein